MPSTTTSRQVCVKINSINPASVDFVLDWTEGSVCCLYYFYCSREAFTLGYIAKAKQNNVALVLDIGRLWKHPHRACFMTWTKNAKNRLERFGSITITPTQENHHCCWKPFSCSRSCWKGRNNHTDLNCGEFCEKYQKLVVWLFSYAGAGPSLPTRSWFWHCA